jgi:pimeloyl-ACP methyl ester carboxylesterase
MHFLRAGSGPDLILLHGLLGTASAWDGAIPALGSRAALYAVDALGVGGSDRVPGLDTRLAAQAGRVCRFMDAVGIDAADFLATSHGGAVALALAGLYPDRVRKMALHAPANPFSRGGEMLIRFYLSPVGRSFASRVTQLPRRLQAAALGRMYGDPSRVRQGSLDRYLQSLRAPGSIDYVLSLLADWSEDMRWLGGILGRLRSRPMLLIWGGRDRAVSLDSARRMQESLPAAELIVLPQAGHLPHEECPEEFTRAVNSYLCGPKASGRGAV